MRIRALIPLIFALLLCGITNARTIYVIDFGLDRAMNREEKFEIIKKAHKHAVSIGEAISNITINDRNKNVIYDISRLQE